MRIVFVINTDCLDYDERVRKEAVTLLALGHEIQIIAMENENLNVSGITHYGIPYTSISIITRKLFRQAQHIYIKAFEMHVKFILQLLKTNWDVLWVHEHSSAGILFYGWFIKVLKKDKKLVWNQHELALDSWIDSRIYRWIINKCDAVIHANQERASYLGRKYQEISPKLQYVINNYPSDSFISEPKHVQSEKLIAWSKGRKYCLFQGGAVAHRKIFECVEAVHSSLCPLLVIMGPCGVEVLTELQRRWPDYKEWVYITGWIDPNLFNKFIDNSMLSLVFYQNIDNNHWLAAPNRFYHAIIRDIPVVCGPNPTMRNIIEKHDVGVTCEHNGEDILEISSAIDKIVLDIDHYVSSSYICKSEFTWESQIDEYVRIIDSIETD